MLGVGRIGSSQDKTDYRDECDLGVGCIGSCQDKSDYRDECDLRVLSVIMLTSVFSFFPLPQDWS